MILMEKKLYEYCERTHTTQTTDVQASDTRPSCCVGCEEGPNGIDVKDYTATDGPPEHAHTKYVGQHVYAVPFNDLVEMRFDFQQTRRIRYACRTYSEIRTHSKYAHTSARKSYEALVYNNIHFIVLALIQK